MGKTVRKNLSFSPKLGFFSKFADLRKISHFNKKKSQFWRKLHIFSIKLKI